MKRPILIALIATLMTIYTLASCCANDYTNQRFGFKIFYTTSWEKYRNPPPENNDGISFTLPGKFQFSASGMYNVMGNSLEKEVQERTKEEKVLKKEKIRMGNLPAIKIMSQKGAQKTTMACAMSKGNKIVYTIYYYGDANAFEKYKKQVDGVIASFRIVKGIERDN